MSELDYEQRDKLKQVFEAMQIYGIRLYNIKRIATHDCWDVTFRQYDGLPLTLTFTDEVVGIESLGAIESLILALLPMPS